MPTNADARFRIEIATPASEPLKVRGDTLETLIAEFLRQQSYRVIENVRNTGTELDIIAEHGLSKRTLLVECKSQKANIQSAAIDGLFTDACLRQVDEAWLVSLAPMGSDAKGKFEVIQRRQDIRFAHITGHDIVEHVIRSGYFADPRPLTFQHPSISNEVALILTKDSAYYCLEHRSLDRQTTQGHSLVSATNLETIQSDALLSLISLTIDAYSEGKWISLTSATQGHSRETLPQSVVDLMPGSDWKDYRPSRPEDFIGREDAIELLTSFIDEARQQKTRTRLFGVKAASGWGKSSLILKTAESLNSNSWKAHLIAVDCRAAVSSDYPHLVLAKAFCDARSKGVEFWGLPSVLPVSDNPFDDVSLRNGLDALRASKAIVVIVFDQFEEIIHSPNKALFAKLESLCYHVDALQLPILLGFSWRTDAMVSAENPGYNLWHRLSDRRFDVQLRAFTHTDAQTYLDRIERLSGSRFAAKDRRFLLDTYVGLPWLLKNSQ